LKKITPAPVSLNRIAISTLVDVLTNKQQEYVPASDTTGKSLKITNITTLYYICSDA